MKVLLVQPSIPKCDIYGRVVAGANDFPPTGLAQLASCIRYQHDVAIIDGWPSYIAPGKLKEEMRRHAPDVVGVTSTTSSHPAAMDIFRMVKRINPAIVTLYGGVHATAMGAGPMLECSEIDYTVLGEGERTLPELLQIIEGFLRPEEVRGIVYRSKGKLRMTARRPPIEDLDSLPWPAYDLLLPLTRYSMHHLRVGGSGSVMNLLMSRGCPHHCIYFDQTVFGRQWRAHSVEYVVGVLRHLHDLYHARRIAFDDDTIDIGTGRTIAICKGIIGASLDISFTMQVRLERVDNEMLEWLHKAGCTSLFFGIESGNPSTLRAIGRAADPENIRSKVRSIHSHGIKVYGSFIYGFPMETKEEALHTQEFALGLGLDGASFHLYTPYPRTDLEKVAAEKGRINPDLRYCSGHAPVPPYVPEGWSQAELLSLQRQSYLRFYLRPQWLIQNVGLLLNPDFARRSLLNLGSLLNPLWKPGGRA